MNLRKLRSYQETITLEESFVSRIRGPGKGKSKQNETKSVIPQEFALADISELRVLLPIIHRFFMDRLIVVVDTYRTRDLLLRKMERLYT